MPRILLLEDNEMNRDIVSRRLSRRGFEILVAEDGAMGVALATAERPDLILMDMSLPVMDGWEATRRLKADPQTQAIPVIALTAHAMSSDREKVFEAGCDDYDTKPVELARLLEKIRAVGLVRLSGYGGTFGGDAAPATGTPRPCPPGAARSGHGDDRLCAAPAGARAKGLREHVVKVQVFLTDINDRAAINPRRISYFGEHRPASTPHSSIRA